MTGPSTSAHIRRPSVCGRVGSISTWEKGLAGAPLRLIESRIFARTRPSSVHCNHANDCNA
ncbi:MAG: hypothetical protein FWF84_07140, partial [Kiritimatiellaeota bacterium]|nr:hypothetical protein [Kiritimatiellota bacterium]